MECKLKSCKKEHANEQECRRCEYTGLHTMLRNSIDEDDSQSMYYLNVALNEFEEEYKDDIEISIRPAIAEIFN